MWQVQCKESHFAAIWWETFVLWTSGNRHWRDGQILRHLLYKVCYTVYNWIVSPHASHLTFIVVCPAKYHELLTIRIFEMKPLCDAAGMYGLWNGPIVSLLEVSVDRIRPLLCPWHCSCLPEDSTGICTPIMTFTSSLKITAARVLFVQSSYYCKSRSSKIILWK